MLAPGSRSAPLALALHADARLRLHVRIDERSASFVALGLGRVTGRPAVLVCTSGTAAANLHPAVLEASEAGVPLLVLTADRPPELRGTGANQTVDQVKLYGAAVRWFAEVGVPEDRPGMAAYWRSLGCRAWAAASTGPVHLNLAFREPLLPDGDPSWSEPLAGRADGRPWTVVEPAGRTAVPADLVARIAGTERGLVVAGAGGGDPAGVRALAERAGWPLLAEPVSSARGGPNAISTYAGLLGAAGWVGRHRPEMILTVGRPGLSRPLLGLLGSGVEQVLLDRSDRWADPTRSVAGVLPVAAAALAAALPATLPADGAAPSGWLVAWRAADRRGRAVLDAMLDAADAPTEPGLARDLADCLPAGSLLLAGSSMPVRDLDLAMRPRDGLRVVANRGASGIDGLVSTAVGAALAHGGPAYALLGDLSLLHDANGLLLGPDEPRPDLTLVVVNNDGGGIFSMLPPAGSAGFERIFGTPHRADLAALAAVSGAGYARLDRLADLPALLRESAGLALVEVRTDRAANAALHDRLRAAVAAALGE